MDNRKNLSPLRVRLYLEELEDRVLLRTNSVEQSAAAVIGAMVRLNDDLATSTLTLVNAVQPSNTNATPLAALANWRA